MVAFNDHIPDVNFFIRLQNKINVNKTVRLVKRSIHVNIGKSVPVMRIQILQGLNIVLHCCKIEIFFIFLYIVKLDFFIQLIGAFKQIPPETDLPDFITDTRGDIEINNNTVFFIKNFRTCRNRVKISALHQITLNLLRVALNIFFF